MKINAPSRKNVSLSLAVAALYPALSVATESAAVLPEVEVQGEAVDSGYRTENSRSATRTETPLRDIPQAITVVPEALIEAQAANKASKGEPRKVADFYTSFMDEAGIEAK